MRLVLVLVLAVTACGGGPSGEGPAICFAADGSKAGACSASELAAYDRCVAGKCPDAAGCFGGQVASGSYGGFCGDWLGCLQKCGCPAPASPCVAACGQPSVGCQQCGVGVVECVNGSGCAKPACLQTNGP